MPALLSLLGDRIDWPRRRHYDAATAAHRRVRPGDDSSLGSGDGLLAIVMARPVVSVVLAAGLLVAGALCRTSISIGGSGGRRDATAETESKTAYELLSRDFPAGTLAPVEIVVEAPRTDPAVQAGIDRLDSLSWQRDPAFRSRRAGAVERQPVTSRSPARPADDRTRVH